MTETLDAGVATRPARPAWYRRRPVLIAALAAMAVLAAVLGFWLRWLYSADALNDQGGTTIGVTRPVGVTIYANFVVAPSDGEPMTLDLQSITPRIAMNTAAAEVHVLICRQGREPVFAIADEHSGCQSVRPFVPGELTIGSHEPGSDTVVLAVTTHQPGHVRIAGVHVTYRDGMRHGSQDTGVDVEVNATEGR